MPGRPSSRNVFQYPALAFGLLAGLVVAFSMLGQQPPGPWIYQAGGPRIPMAPQTGVSALALMLALVLPQIPWRQGLLHRCAAASLTLAAAMNSLAMLGLLLGPDSPTSLWIIRNLINFPRVSPLTVLAHSGATLGLALSLGWLGRGWARRQTGALAAMLPLGVGGLVVFSYLAKAPLFYGTLAVPMSFGAALSALLLGQGILLASEPDTWPLALFIRRMPEQGPMTLKRFLRHPLVVFVTLTLTLLAAGSLFRRVQLARAERAIHAQLSTIADQKVERIAVWHEARVQEARQLFRSALVQNQLQAFLDRRPMAPTQAELLGWMEDLRNTGAYDEITLFDAQGNQRLSTRPADQPGQVRPHVQVGLRAGQVQEVDLHQDSARTGVHLSFWVPVRPDPQAGRPALGVLMLLVDAESFLFPMIRSWPNPSISAETLLVRREGDEVVLLNEQRHSEARPLERRFAIAQYPTLTVVKAVTGGEGFITALDYRGVPVVAATRQVPGTAWWMVAKIDQAEVFEPLRVRNFLTVTTLAAVVMLLALGAGLMLRGQDNQQILNQLQLERERKTLAERFQQIMHQANDIILLMTPDGHILEANERATEAYGYPLAELETMNIRELRAPESLPDVDSNLTEFVQGGLTRMETIHRRRDGSAFPVEVSARPVHFGDETFLLSFVRDITDRRQQAHALQRMTQLYSALSQVNQAIVWSGTQEELFNKICQVLVEHGGFKMVWVGRHDETRHTVLPVAQFGVSQDYFETLEVRTDDTPLGHGPIGTALRENRPCLFKNFLEAPETTPWHAQAARAGFASAAAFPVCLHGDPLFALAVYAVDQDFFGEQEMALVEEAALDLSFALAHLDQDARRTSAEAALRQSEARLKTLTECAPDIIVTLDAAGQVCYVNRVFGHTSQAEILGQPWLGWVPLEDRGAAQAALDAALATGQTQEFETRGTSASGAIRWYRARISPILGAQAGEALVLFATDITQARKALAEQFQLAAQLAQSQKLESLGSLAGGVAHDMNNVLGAILSLASAHREALTPGAPMASSLDTIINACLRGRGVVKSLLYFAHKDLEQVTAIDINALVQEMVQLLAYTTLKRINLAMQLQDGLGTLQGDSGALSHTLMNLCVNAMDAMPGGGSLTLSTALLADGRLQLSVQDTGFGMAKDIQEKALEPFFTTKPQGKGTGLGLSMAYATMKAHDGTLEIRSAPGAGTQILLTFPAARMSSAPAAPSPTRPEGSVGHGPWRLLLVDDDELIRHSVAPMLELLGHRVSTAPGGLEALAMLEQGLQVDLVILDMNMPGLNGAATLPRILELRPGQPVLMATGYSDEDLSALLDGRANVSSIRKPFSLTEIRDKFTEILG